MGNGMNKVLPGVYLGSIRDAKDSLQLKENNITHIVSIHENAKKLHSHIEYLCISASDSPDQDLSQYFSICNDFIHRARINGGNILIHCLAGVSRSVTVTVAYIMTITNLGWRDSLNVVRNARKVANPNFGFQRQLLAFEHDRLPQERRRFKSTNKPSPHNDEEIAKKHLEEHWRWVLEGDKSESKSESNDPGAGLYPLPNNAYRSEAKVKLTREGDDKPKERKNIADKVEINSEITTQDAVDGDETKIEESGDDNTSTKNPRESNDLADAVEDLFASN